ncbi:hypothetical protein WOSG25_050600 [Weissella oryzae SG25]|uniref:Gram-positive cocci surface proteins LPxTG domain-containing protein n=1 Tax=Weissella oryzae (strain DSM 25784 / JCM 18191 / LMG 30913 / SG25) TaxID=1329250 RepID=A0A069CUC0_WEIOS|nr:serine-rich aggregation substance UasX [Weissella oryzae]GAK30788.1 hypothetical protein WOSG25_050600 [Weissella oryzae SG25]
MDTKKVMIASAVALGATAVGVTSANADQVAPKANAQNSSVTQSSKTAVDLQANTLSLGTKTVKAASDTPKANTSTPTKANTISIISGKTLNKDIDDGTSKDIDDGTGKNTDDGTGKNTDDGTGKNTDDGGKDNNGGSTTDGDKDKGGSTTDGDKDKGGSTTDGDKDKGGSTTDGDKSNGNSTNTDSNSGTVTPVPVHPDNTGNTIQVPTIAQSAPEVAKAVTSYNQALADNNGDSNAAAVVQAKEAVNKAVADTLPETGFTDQAGFSVAGIVLTAIAGLFGFLKFKKN